jgi:hypothetical protein
MKKSKMKKKIKKKNFGDFLRENYSQSWKYIKESKKFILAVIILFCISILIGFL